MKKEIVALRETLDQMYLINIFRAFHPKSSEYRFYTSTHGAFTKVDLMFQHKIRHNKCKTIEIILSTFSDHRGMKVEFNYKKKKNMKRKHKDMEAKQHGTKT